MKPKPFKIPKNLPKPLTFEEMGKKYGLTDADIKRIKRDVQTIINSKHTVGQ